MGDTVIANADTLEVSLLLGVTDGGPAILSNPRATEWGMHQIEIDIFQTASFKGSFNGFLCCVVSNIGFEFRRVENFRAWSLGRFTKITDGTTTLGFVLIPLCCILLQLRTQWKKRMRHLRCGDSRPESCISCRAYEIAYNHCNVPQGPILPRCTPLRRQIRMSLDENCQ